MISINYNDIYVLVLLLTIISILIYRYLTILRRYLKEIILVSNKVSNGDFSVKLKNQYSGDLGRLSNNFNFMITKINNNIEELEDKNIKLKSILKSISNGIVAIDNDETILLINDVAKEIFNYESDKFEGEKIDKVINNDVLLKSIKNLIPIRKSTQIQIEDEKDRFYKVKIDPILLKNAENVIIGSIINIEDVTENVKLEKIRSDFVANVTHELKTPLTSINGFIETLKSNNEIDIETRNRFLDIIDIESNRLRRLIDDILMLSFIENNKNDKYEDVNLWETFEEVFDLTFNLAKNKNINYTYNFPSKDIYLKTNKDYIKQIFVNLIDNAIKYTPEEGSVRVLVKEDSKNIKISVKDTGIGIPDEDIPRIFERFYRVDKARSKKIGGTGLGLAILKHIVISLNGKIEVNSELNKGTEFIVIIPK
ncbi:HAMP domain-containing sensor histidine kinase [Tepidibacter formicigenes]|uniref:histidine kinase n=1 Tax=Tepidibacter formicigenes DSM 15518 TaxID=1123349 RepID=A0A1M6KDE0_9FIRM|nr:HAMP domain-containing sensor histidine kinase [Tepidibacter formicigenes]SHJ56964.1 two-component system, OmpR family, phosphate regulon sensor histidine kinase PhoR [Tepidibacter formicigenes DSM 15518]